MSFGEGIMADSSPTLDHIEKTLADAYRKEIDQEENVWRSLPFFAATLAFQLAALVQLLGHMPPAGTPGARIALLCALLAGVATASALAFLIRSVQPVRFRYIASEPDLLAYAEGLEQDQKDGGPEALPALKRTLARQYAEATQHNREINQMRVWRRSVAGLATLVSVLATLALVVTVAATYIPPRPTGTECIHGESGVPAAAARAGHAGGDQGLVDPARGTPAAGGIASGGSP